VKRQSTCHNEAFAAANAMQLCEKEFRNHFYYVACP
jgi:hypothetical protein